VVGTAATKGIALGEPRPALPLDLATEEASLFSDLPACGRPAPQAASPAWSRAWAA